MTWKWERPLREIPPAKLVVTPSEWSVEAYWPGPDARYSGTYFRLPGSQVSEYAHELIRGWERFCELDKTAPDDVNLSVQGALGTRIVVRGFPGRGVTMKGLHGLISSKDQLVRVLHELSGLQSEAEAVRQLLDERPHSGPSPEEPISPRRAKLSTKEAHE